MSGAKLLDERGQMTVELCIVIPVCLIIAVIVVNSLTFFAQCAAFDRVGRNAARTVAAVPSDGATTAQMEADILGLVEEEMEGIEVSCRSDGRVIGDGFSVDSLGYTTYVLTFEYAPTLFGLPLRGSVFGVDLPRLQHSTALTVDGYTPGKLLD